MHVNLIYARARNGVIGRANSLPWQLPEDLARFKRLTSGLPVIMGRKTWDSLPAKFRPLPGRANFVVTRQRDWRANGAESAASLELALAACAKMQIQPQQAWIIGGAQLFELALPLAGRIELTELTQDFDGDTYAPRLDAHWIETAREDMIAANGTRFAFVTYLKHTPEKASPDV